MAEEKNITIDELALMIGKGFNGVDDKFKKAEDNADVRFNKIESRLKTIENKVGDVVYRNEFNKLDGKVKEIENILNAAGIKV